jgi:hypothetical protein
LISFDRKGRIYTTILISGSRKIKRHIIEKKGANGYNYHLAVTKPFFPSFLAFPMESYANAMDDHILI